MYLFSFSKESAIKLKLSILLLTVVKDININKHLSLHSDLKEFKQRLFYTFDNLLSFLFLETCLERYLESCSRAAFKSLKLKLYRTSEGKRDA